MAKMLRHKETGELFIWTSHLAALSELEPVVEDPVAAVIAEMAAQTDSTEDASMVDEVLILDVVPAPDFVEVPSFAEATVAKATPKKRSKAA